jgi:hypothetical protein
VSWPDLNVWHTGFMSSVDLHIHSRFQQMLPESFAVVCAPNSTPRYASPAGGPAGRFPVLITHSTLVQLRDLPPDGARLTNDIRMPNVGGISPASRAADIYRACPPISTVLEMIIPISS